MPQLPIIDFTTFGTNAIGEAIGEACRSRGFFLLANHGLDAKLIDMAFAQAKEFFDHPDLEKQKIAIEKSPCHRGWFGAGGEVLDGVQQPEGDDKQGIKIGRDLSAAHPRVREGLALHGANQWPDPDVFPDFKPIMQSCYDACETLSRQLMQGFALSLNLKGDYFEPWLTLPMATLTPLRYPPMRDATKLGAGAHTDFGCLTLLLQHDEAGLEIQAENGDWFGVPATPDLVVVNIGDMMARWTNNIYASTRHRVVNRSRSTRHSMAYFFDPDPDAPLAPLPGCLCDGATPIYEDTNALDHLLQKIEDSFAYRQDSSQ